MLFIFNLNNASTMNATIRNSSALYGSNELGFDMSAITFIIVIIMVCSMGCVLLSLCYGIIFIIKLFLIITVAFYDCYCYLKENETKLNQINVLVFSPIDKKAIVFSEIIING